jgi:hypothetical protein
MDYCCCYGTKNSALLVLDMELLLQLHSHSAIASSLGKKENQSDPRAKEIALGMDRVLLRKSIRSRTPPIDRQRKKASTNTGTLVCETLIGRESGRERKTRNFFIKKYSLQNQADCRGRECTRKQAEADIYISAPPFAPPAKAVEREEIALLKVR